MLSSLSPSDGSLATAPAPFLTFFSAASLLIMISIRAANTHFPKYSEISLYIEIDPSKNTVIFFDNMLIIYMRVLGL